jgi:hypothetical protein
MEKIILSAENYREVDLGSGTVKGACIEASTHVAVVIKHDKTLLHHRFRANWFLKVQRLSFAAKEQKAFDVSIWRYDVIRKNYNSRSLIAIHLFRCLAGVIYRCSLLVSVFLSYPYSEYLRNGFLEL